MYLPSFEEIQQCVFELQSENEAGQTDGRTDGSRDSNCPYLLSGETIFLLTPKKLLSGASDLGKHLPFNHIVSDEALFNISKILKTSSSYSAKTKSDGRTLCILASRYDFA